MQELMYKNTEENICKLTKVGVTRDKKAEMEAGLAYTEMKMEDKEIKMPIKLE